ncbi:MAG TPA: hypothetical protein VJH03_09970 [Blastocatellia bacterium]|nr:hypothetical protein [Blastocatellia bacterium]
MLTAPAILILLAIPTQLPSADKSLGDLKAWKPGPRVAQEITRLERDGRAMFRLFRDGKLAQWTVMREPARLKVTIEVLREWSFVNQTNEMPQLVVVLVDDDSDESRQVFPRGKNHLPRDVVAGETYASTRDGSRSWQYLGERRVTGMRFAVFRSAQGSGAGREDYEKTSEAKGNR